MDLVNASPRLMLEKKKGEAKFASPFFILLKSFLVPAEVYFLIQR